MDDRAEFLRSYVNTRGPALSRAAFLLTGDRQAAEDLLQETYVVLVRRRRHIDLTNPDPYVRRITYRRFVDGRRRARLREFLLPARPDRGGGTDDPAGPADRLALREALSRLTPRQRALIVLRLYEDLTEVQAAAALGVSVGTVRSQTRAALQRLREGAPATDVAADPASGVGDPVSDPATQALRATLIREAAEIGPFADAALAVQRVETIRRPWIGGASLAVALAVAGGLAACQEPIGQPPASRTSPGTSATSLTDQVTGTLRGTAQQRDVSLRLPSSGWDVPHFSAYIEAISPALNGVSVIANPRLWWTTEDGHSIPASGEALRDEIKALPDVQVEADRDVVRDGIRFVQMDLTLAPEAEVFTDCIDPSTEATYTCRPLVHSQSGQPELHLRPGVVSRLEVQAAAEGAESISVLPAIWIRDISGPDAQDALSVAASVRIGEAYTPQAAPVPDETKLQIEGYLTAGHMGRDVSVTLPESGWSELARTDTTGSVDLVSAGGNGLTLFAYPALIDGGVANTRTGRELLAAIRQFDAVEVVADGEYERAGDWYVRMDLRVAADAQLTQDCKLVAPCLPLIEGPFLGTVVELRPGVVSRLEVHASTYNVVPAIWIHDITGPDSAEAIALADAITIGEAQE